MSNTNYKNAFCIPLKELQMALDIKDVHPHQAARYGKETVMPPFPIEVYVELLWWHCEERLFVCVFCLVIEFFQWKSIPV